MLSIEKRQSFIVCSQVKKIETKNMNMLLMFGTDFKCKR